MEAIRQKLEQFIQERFLAGRSVQALGAEDSLFDRGVIDSVGVLELVAFMEQSFGIVVEDEELVPDNLDSLNRLALFIKTKSAKQDMIV